MRIKTLVLISLTAVLAANVNGNLRQASLPVSQNQASANAPQRVKLELISPEIATKVVTKERNNKEASRSKTRVEPSNVSANQEFAKSYMLSQYNWGEDQFSCLVSLWQRESGWNHNAKNKSSGAYGIPQSLPGTKMASAGSDWKTNPHTQIKWGLTYINKRYETPCGAWGAFKKKGWY